MITEWLGPIINHLWQSTLFAVLVALAAFVMRRNHARARYWLWMAATAKFVIPFALLVSVGGRVEIPVTPTTLKATAVEQFTTSFAPLVASYQAPKPANWPILLWAIWMAGFAFLMTRWFREWRDLQRAARSAQIAAIVLPIPVLVSHDASAPGVFGLFRQVLLFPEGMEARLTPDELKTILVHEMCHARNYDNLTAAFHMLITATFWFHPLLWWIGRKLIEERERACDEAVLEQGLEPETYANGILNVCKFYLEPQLACVAGVTGADLKIRIEEIMTQRRLLNLTLARKTLLAGAAMGACALPLVIGILRAQTLPPPPAYRYDVASVKPSAVGARGSGISPGPQGGLRSRNTTAIQLVTFAYHVQQYQVLGAPGWADADRFDVSFTPEKEDPRPGLEADLAKREGHSTRNRHRLRAVLRDRFGLVMRSEIREMPIYALTWVKNAKNRPTPASEAAPFNLMASSGTISAKSGSMPMLAVLLSDFLGRTVIDETGMAGVYDMELTFATDAAIQMRRKPGADAPPQPVDNGAPTIFTALTEQLGLRLESKKGPVQVYVIEKLEKPSAN